MWYAVRIECVCGCKKNLKIRGEVFIQKFHFFYMKNFHGAYQRRSKIPKIKKQQKNLENFFHFLRVPFGRFSWIANRIQQICYYQNEIYLILINFFDYVSGIQEIFSRNQRNFKIFHCIFWCYLINKNCGIKFKC